MNEYVSLALARRQIRATQHAGWLAGGKLRLYTTPRPATPETAVTTQTLLCEFDMADPFGTVVNAIMTGSIPAPALIAETGTPVWGRYVDSVGETVSDADVGLTGSGAAIIVENASFVQGALAALMSQVIEEG
jgi:alanine-alpha-ketoisovalerate/valine-pyruvate aminotransferase